jgi:excisionase family DNA binding protein
VIDVATEKLLTIVQAAERLQVSKATVTAWIKRGTHGIRLDAIKFGIHWRTSEEAIQRFGDCQTPSFEVRSHSTPARSTAAELRLEEQIQEQLDELFGVRKCSTCREKIDTGKIPIPKDTKLLCPKCIVNRPSAGIGKRLQCFRWARQLSLQALHMSTRLSIERIREYEQGSRKPTEDHLRRLVEFFGPELVKNLKPHGTDAHNNASQS